VEQAAMTHTYLRRGEDSYEIGQWLIHREGHHHFVALFAVPSLKQAFVAVNHLNGGTRISVDALHLEERE
jgi:hypothetical protein